MNYNSNHFSRQNGIVDSAKQPSEMIMIDMLKLLVVSALATSLSVRMTHTHKRNCNLIKFDQKQGNLIKLDQI